MVKNFEEVEAMEKVRFDLQLFAEETPAQAQPEGLYRLPGKRIILTFINIRDKT